MATQQYRFEKLDSAENAFFSRQLAFIKANTYDVKYPELKARMFLPVDGGPGPGAEVIIWRSYDMRGSAMIVSDYANDFPRADVLGTENVSHIRSIGASYGYSVQEIRAAQMAGLPLDQRKANAARNVIERLIDAIARFGDTAHKLVGFLNQPNTSVYTVPQGASTHTDWARKTAAEILADLHGIANGIVTDTKEVEIPDTILLPLAQYTLIASLPFSTLTGATVLKQFLASSPYIKDVQPWHFLKNAGDTDNDVDVPTVDRMVCYRKDPMALQMIVPQEFEQFPPEAKGMTFEIACHARTGGVIVYYPLSVSFGDGI